MERYKLVAAILISALLICASSVTVYSGSIDNIRVLKIAPQDGRAIIKTDARELKVIKVNDELQINGSGLRVVEIAEGRVVFEKETASGKETLIVRLDKGKQWTEVLRRVPEKKPLFYKPVDIERKEGTGYSGNSHGSSID